MPHPKWIDTRGAAALRPWFLSISLATPACAIDEIAGGEGAMDVRFAGRAAAAGIPVRGMETWETLLPVLQADEWSEAALDGLVMSAREAAHARDAQTTSARLYAQETVWPIWYMGVEEAGAAGMEADFEQTRETLFRDRNRRFVEAAAPELAKGGVFVMVGSLHLGGEGGMIELLRARGFRVKRAALR